ncbi:MAG: hypothetical protein ACJAS6_000028 [Rickettsiales bacterium]|jgi:hypothetical protein
MKNNLINFKIIFGFLLFLNPLNFTSQALAQDLECESLVSSDLLFKISIDGDEVANADETCNDIALQKAKIQIRFDSLEISPALNITAFPNGVARGSNVIFTPYSNYLPFISKAEVRIFNQGISTQTEPLAILNLEKSLNDSLEFMIPNDLYEDSLQYVIRVYDKEDRFDETEPKLLKLLDSMRLVGDEESLEREKNIGYGENHLKIQNIPLSGGTIVVNGSNLESGSRIFVMNQEVPIDANGKFAYRQISKSGDHEVDVKIKNPDGLNADLNRSLEIPSNDLFYIALADFTVGQNNVTGPAALVTGDNTKRYQEKTYFDGRLAFYLKGKVKDGWVLTSSADTQENAVEDLFSNFSAKDSRALLRRIDPQDHYPIYGDDSTAVEDAPTQGKFYVKLENETTKVMWGNFQTRINGTELINYSRALYGAAVEHKSSDMTKYGEARTEGNGFMADPGSISSLEEFRGTGGSLYYLKAQDIVRGSERLRIEVRDRDSGIVLKVQELAYGQDYEINYIQGRVILREPLSSVSSAGTLVNNGSDNGNPAYLITGYEYTPSITSIQNLTRGGHVSHWLNDYVKIGATSYNQSAGEDSQDLKGADLTLRYKPQTYFRIEGAESTGAGSRSIASQDGGFNFNSISQTKSEQVTANAYRLETSLDFAELSDGKKEGNISGYYVKRQDGYSAPGQLTNEDIVQSGVLGQFPVNEKLIVNLKADLKRGSETGTIKTAEVSGGYQINDKSTISLAVRNDDRDTKNNAGGNSSVLSQTGRRIDMATKLNYAPISEAGVKSNYEIYATAQGTVAKDVGRERNNRAGVGGQYDINKKVTLSGEGTSGDGGFGSKAGIEYRPTDRTSYYTNYEMDTQRTDFGSRGRNSSLTSGAKSRYSDSLSMYTEQRQQEFAGGSSGLLHAFGLDLAANDRWNFGGKFEAGVISDIHTGDIERNTLSLNSNYHLEKIKYANVVEWRHENGNINGELDAYLIRNNLSYQTTPDWRFLGEANFAISKSDLGSNLEANYSEISTAYAYRPIENDKVNGLLKYVYLSDLETQGQLNSSGGGLASDFEQRSHVFAGDVIVDVIPQLSVGGKLGYRFGEIRSTATKNEEWFGSAAYLAIFRTDLHIVKKWDVSGEARYLAAEEAEDAKSGFLAGVYRHIGSNGKIGVGYNFTDFSDDLTNLDYRSQGFFINVIGKF